MPSSVVHHQSSNELSLGIHLVLHLHNLNHVEIDGLGEGIDSGSSLCWRRRLNGEDGVDDGGSELGSEFGVKFGSERGVGDGDEGSSIHGLGDFEGVEELRERKAKGREGKEERGELKLRKRELTCFFLLRPSRRSDSP